MKLALNTYVYEVAKWPIEKTLRSARRQGFKHTEYAACGSGDPTRMSARKRREVVKLSRDLGLHSSQTAGGSVSLVSRVSRWAKRATPWTIPTAGCRQA